MVKNSIEGTMVHLGYRPWTCWVGFRYLKSKKNSRFLSFITLLSMMGIGLGVMAMIVVLSVMDGFESELKKRMMSSDLHVLIRPRPDSPGFDMGFVPRSSMDRADISAFLDSAGSPVEKFWPVIATEAILKAGRKVTGVTLKGVTKDRIEQLKWQGAEILEKKDEVDQKNTESTGLWVGQELAMEMGLVPGDHLTLVSPTEMEGPLGGIPRLKRFYIHGIYRSGLPEQELHITYASEGAVRSFLRRSDRVSQWELKVKNFDQAPQVAAQIQSMIPQFQVQDWFELNSHLFASLRLERLSMFLILAFIVVVASFNIVTTLTLMVLEKKKEISILKAMGATKSQIGSIFFAEGILIGSVGAGGGGVLGFLVCLILKHYEFITLPDIYYDRTLPVTFNPIYYFVVTLCAMVIVLLACLYPSRKAAQLNPLTGIRFG